MPEWKSKPFHGSLEALAQIALQETAASGYAFYKEDSRSGAMIRLLASGEVVPYPASSDQVKATIEYPLSKDGPTHASIVFSYESNENAEAARPRLHRIVAAIESLWAAEPAELFLNLVSRVAGLEMQLIDSKITDRARGFLTAPTNSDPSEVIARHVESVLRPSAARRILENVLLELEQEMEERKLVARAKQILQGAHGISEEQAHRELRVASRKSRKPLRDVALQVIGPRQLPKGKTA